MKKLLSFVTTALLYTVAAGADVVGTIYSLDGKPLSGVEVQAFAPEATRDRAQRVRSSDPVRKPLVLDGQPVRTTTSADGNFKLPLPPGVTVEVTFDRERHTAHSVIALSGGDPFAFALREARTIEGRVRAGSKPVRDAIVIFRGQQREFLVRSAADGTFKVSDPSLWAQRVEIHHPDFAPYSSYLRRTSDGLQFELAAGKKVSGRLRGSGAAGAQLFAGDILLGTASDDGLFSLSNVPPDVIRLEAISSQTHATISDLSKPVDVAMQPGRFVEGVVKMTDGTTRSGVAVNLNVYDEEGLPVTVIVDAKGVFRAGPLRPARYAVFAAAPDAVPERRFTDRMSREDEGVVDLRSELTARRELILTPMPKVRGRVVDEANQPVGGVALVLAPGFERSTSMIGFDGVDIRSRNDGRFVLVSPFGEATQELRVFAFRQGFATSRSATFKLPDLGKGEVVVTLRKGIAVAGKVIEANGRPIAGADVGYVSRDEAGYRPRAEFMLFTSSSTTRVKSAADGSFTLHLDEGEYELAAQAPGFRIAAVPLTLAGPVKPITITLERGVEIRGRVVRAGKGVAGINVHLVDERRPRDGMLVTSVDGTFTITDLAPGSYQVVFQKYDALIHEISTIKAPAGSFVLELPPAVELKGLAETSNGTPLPDYRLFVQRVGAERGDRIRGEQMLSREIRDERGQFVIELPTGEYEVYASAEGFLTSDAQRATLTAESPSPMKIVLASGATLRGRVTDDAGNGLPNVSVALDLTVDQQKAESVYRMSYPQATTDSSGDFTIKGIAPGNAVVVARKEGFVPFRKQTEIGDVTTLDIAMSRGITITGTVTADGKPLAGVEVSASSVVVGAEGQSTQTNDQGEFTMTGLMPVRYSVTASHESHGHAELKDIDVRSVNRVALRLRGSERGTIVGRVTGLPSVAASKAVVRNVTAYSDRGSVQTAIDASGAFRIEDAPAGEVRVAAHVQSDRTYRSTAEKLVELAPGGTVEVTLEFPELVIVRGLITREGSPLPRANVTFQDDTSNGGSSGTTDQTGEYEVALERLGNHRISIHAPDFRGMYQIVRNITGSATVDLDIRFNEIDGRVVDAASKAPLRDAFVTLVLADGRANVPMAESRTASNGDFSIAVPAEGAYRLLVEKTGYGQKSVDVTSNRSPLTIELVMTEGMLIRVTDGRDRSVLQAVVQVRDLDGKLAVSRFQQMRPDGMIELPLSPGRYRATVSAYGYASRTIEVTSPGSLTEVALTPGGSVRIDSPRELRGTARLIGAGGVPHIPCCEGSASIRLTGTRTIVENVAPGPYIVEIIGVNGEVVARTEVPVNEGAQSVAVIQ